MSFAGLHWTGRGDAERWLLATRLVMTAATARQLSGPRLAVEAWNSSSSSASRHLWAALSTPHITVMLGSAAGGTGCRQASCRAAAWQREGP